MQPVKSTHTDENGEFQFAYLALEQYSIWVDKPFIDNAMAPQITVSLDTPYHENLEFLLHSTWLERVASNPNQIESLTKWNLKLFPNPAQTIVNVSFSLPNPHQVQIQLFDLMGRQLKFKEVYTQDYLEPWQIGDLAKGVYVLEFRATGLPPVYIKIEKE